MKNLIGLLLTCFVLFLFHPAIESAIAFEHGYDRPGGQLVGKYTGVSNAQHCYNLCSRNANCVAFTWVKPNIQGPTGVCWLKGSLSNKVRNNCCVSGVVRTAKQDRCKWFQKGTTYTCYCQNNRTKKWYPTNPGACPQQKPPPKYIDRRRNNCPPGKVWVGGSGVFGQGDGYCK
jgi:hypothetical protein